MTRFSSSLIGHLTWVVVLAITTRHADADPKSEAKVHIDRAGALFAAEKPAEALAELKTAFALDPQPPLLYAIGQVHASLGQCADAKTFFERYLTTKPSANEAGLAREAIKVCKDKPQISTPEPEPKPEPKPVVVAPLPPAVAAPWYTDYVGDALVGAGVITGIIALFEARAATSDRDKAEDATNFETFADLIDSSQTKRTVSIVLGVAGVALIGGGVARFLLHDRSTAPRVEVVPTQGGAAITWGHRF